MTGAAESEQRRGESDAPRLASDDDLRKTEVFESMDPGQVSGHAVVIGLEDSTGARTALAWAVDVLADAGWPFVLAHAYPDVTRPPTWGWSDLVRTLDIEAGLLADDAEKSLTGAGVDPATIQRVLRPESPVALLRALSERARMVVVGRQGSGSLLDKLVGSTAYSLAEHSHAPVVVVPDGWKSGATPGRPVVLGLDHGYDEAAIVFAFDLARVQERRLKVVHVVKPLHRDDGAEPESERERAERLAAQRGWASEQLAPLRDQRYPDVNVDIEVEEGAPVDILLWQATDASLVVIGGKPRHRLVPAPLGSVGHALLRRCSCPLAIAHAG